MRNFILIQIFIIATSIIGILKAQIAIAPSFVFVDENSGVGNVYVSNNSDKAYEVSVNFVFGYPGSDADGNLVMNYTDSISSAKYALDPMIRAFPRSFVLKGGEQRTVRLQVIPAERRKEGYFFTRMKVLAKPQTADVTEPVTTGIGTKINFNFEQITAVFYHKGKVSTSVEVKELDLRQNEKMLEIRPLLLRTGNSPFLGSMTAKLKDGNGKVVSETQSTTTVYFEEIRRMDLKLDNVTPGTYTLEFSLETQRSDMLASDLVQAPRIIKIKTIDIK